MNTQAYVTKPGYPGHYENIDIPDADIQRAVPQPKPVKIVPRHNTGHPLLIVGIILGVVFGLIAACPPAMRGWVILCIIGLVVWFGWSVNHDHAAQASWVAPVTDTQVVEVRRAELVKLPSK